MKQAWVPVVTFAAAVLLAFTHASPRAIALRLAADPTSAPICKSDLTNLRGTVEAVLLNVDLKKPDDSGGRLMADVKVDYEGGAKDGATNLNTSNYIRLYTGLNVSFQVIKKPAVPGTPPRTVIEQTFLNENFQGSNVFTFNFTGFGSKKDITAQFSSTGQRLADFVNLTVATLEKDGGNAKPHPANVAKDLSWVVLSFSQCTLSGAETPCADDFLPLNIGMTTKNGSGKESGVAPN